MATSYHPVFLWVPTKLVTGSWAWLRKVQRISNGGLRTYRDYVR